MIKVYGPYERATDKRKFVALHYGDGKRRSLTYAKYLMQKHLGRELGPSETVDHINRDCTDDRIENLRVVSLSQHVSEDRARVKDSEVECIWCGEAFVISGRSIRDRLRNKAGPFCSRSCSGKYGVAVQYGRIEKLNPQHHEREYYYLDKAKGEL